MLLDLALEELDVLDAGLLLVLAREREHLVGHVEPIGLAGGADAAGRQEHVDPAATAEVEHDLTREQVGERRRVAAAEAGEHRSGRKVAGLIDAVEAAGDVVHGLDGCGRPATAAAAAGLGLARSDRSLGVVVADLGLEFRVLRGLAHGFLSVVQIKYA